MPFQSPILTLPQHYFVIYTYQQTLQNDSYYGSEISLHHEKGIPLLYFDQLTPVANQLKQIKTQQSPDHNKADTLNKSVKETKCYFLKMLNAMAIHGTL